MSAALAYVLSRFPLLSETFLLREIVELQRQGCDPGVYSIKRLRPTVRHPESARVESAVQFLELGSARTLRANLRALSHSPTFYARLLGLTVAGNRESPEFLLKGLAVFPGAVEMAERMRAQGVRHVHAHYGTHPALVALLTSELIGASYSFTVHAHDLFVETAMLREKARRAKFIVAISEFNRNKLLELCGPDTADKISVVRCGVDLDDYHFRRRLPGPDALSLLAVGSLQEYKGLEHLIRACRLLRQSAPEAQLVCRIAGEGPLYADLQRLVSSLGLEREVQLLGGQDQHAVRRLMQESDLLVLPSIVARNGQMEGIPVTLMEALAVGLPVVASRLSGIPELIRHGDTGLLAQPGEPQSIAGAVLECWRSPAEAAERARRGRDLVEHEYSLRRNVSMLIDLYREALGVVPPALHSLDHERAGAGPGARV